MLLYPQYPILREEIQPQCADIKEPIFTEAADAQSGEESNQCQKSSVQGAGFIWQAQAAPPLSDSYEIRSVTKTAHSQNTSSLKPADQEIVFTPTVTNWFN